MIVFDESHITDGSINVDVTIDGEYVGSIYMDLHRWTSLYGMGSYEGQALDIIMVRTKIDKLEMEGAS